MPFRHGWNRHTILAALRFHQITLRELEQRYNLAPNSLSTIWSRPHKPSERAIADFLGEPVEKLFPDRYRKKGNRISNQSYPANTSKNKPSSEAA